MITPRFHLTQDENTITINIRAPMCDLRDLDISIDNEVFIFVSKPYYLRLHLPGALKDIGDPPKHKNSFDADTGEFTFILDKATPGEHFQKLDFITSLLCPTVKVTADDGSRMIEVLTSEGAVDEQVEPSCQYGFAMRGGYKVGDIFAEFSHIFAINPLETQKLEDRMLKKIEDERKTFDSEHYLADLYEPDAVNALLAGSCKWKDLCPGDIKFTADELDFLKDLKNIEYNLSDFQKTQCYYVLIDILYAYCYDQKSTDYESNCESGWTISTLSAGISYFCSFESVKEVIVSCYRRSLTYPLYRNFNLCETVLFELIQLINLGEKLILKCLIEIYNIFVSGASSRYVINNLFIKDYIVYIMKWDKTEWLKIVEELKDLNITKTDLDLDIPNIELTAMLNSLAIINSEDSETETDSDDYDENDSGSTDS